MDKNITITDVLSAVKDMCLSCKGRVITNVLECNTQGCPLWDVRGYIIKNGDKRKWETTPKNSEKSSEEPKSTVSSVKAGK